MIDYDDWQEDLSSAGIEVTRHISHKPGHDYVSFIGWRVCIDTLNDTMSNITVSQEHDATNGADLPTLPSGHSASALYIASHYCLFYTLSAST